jgi:hypothetical protein
LVGLTLGGISACSSDKTDEATGRAGSGGAATAGTGGSSGSSSSTAGSTNNTSGSSGALCAGKMNMCLDAQTVRGCDPLTGMDVTVSCDEDVEEGFVNLGCNTSSQGTEACLLDVEDPVCYEGAAIFAVCAQATQDDIIPLYLGCYHDMNGAKTIIPCYIDYADEATLTVDCMAADEACLPPGLGGGGAPADGGAGPGPEPMGGAGGAD